MDLRRNYWTESEDNQIRQQIIFSLTQLYGQLRHHSDKRSLTFKEIEEAYKKQKFPYHPSTLATYFVDFKTALKAAGVYFEPEKNPEAKHFSKSDVELWVKKFILEKRKKPNSSDLNIAYQKGEMPRAETVEQICTESVFKMAKRFWAQYELGNLKL